MFLDFFFKLKDARIPVTLNEFFTFLDTIKLDFIQFNTENFYYMARASLVKDERLIDRFDVVFGEYFKGIETLKLEDVLAQSFLKYQFQEIECNEKNIVLKMPLEVLFHY